MTSTTMASLNAATDPVSVAKKTLSRFPIWKLVGAVLLTQEDADKRNPHDYHDRYVIIESTTWFGFKWEKTIYAEKGTYDDLDMMAVLSYATGLISAVNRAQAR